MFQKRPTRRVSLYVILGLTKNASQEDIHKAYELLLRRYAEEATGQQGDAPKQKIRELQRAYNILSDVKKRKVYDTHGAVGAWVKLKSAFSPEVLDNLSASMKRLWFCCFGATCCCFCYCCCHCCHSDCMACNDIGEDDVDELYIRNTFSEYLADAPASCPNFMTRRRTRKQRRRAAQKHRQQFYVNRQEVREARRRRKNQTNETAPPNPEDAVPTPATETEAGDTVTMRHKKPLTRGRSGDSGIDNDAFSVDSMEHDFDIGDNDTDEETAYAIDSGRASAEICSVVVHNDISKENHTIADNVFINQGNPSSASTHGDATINIAHSDCWELNYSPLAESTSNESCSDCDNHDPSSEICAPKRTSVGSVYGLSEQESMNESHLTSEPQNPVEEGQPVLTPE